MPDTKPKPDQPAARDSEHPPWLAVPPGTPRRIPRRLVNFPHVLQVAISDGMNQTIDRDSAKADLPRAAYIREVLESGLVTVRERYKRRRSRAKLKAHQANSAWPDSDSE